MFKSIALFLIIALTSNSLLAGTCREYRHTNVGNGWSRHESRECRDKNAGAIVGGIIGVALLVAICSNSKYRAKGRIRPVSNNKNKSYVDDLAIVNYRKGNQDTGVEFKFDPNKRCVAGGYCIGL